MVQAYLRHGPTESFGVIVSPSAPSLFDGRRAYVPALEDILIWDIKSSTLLGMWHSPGHSSPVTAFTRSPVDWNLFAVGYGDGSIRIWNKEGQGKEEGGDGKGEVEVRVRLDGHKSAVTVLKWDKSGTLLASGSRDTDVIVWDTVGEVGIVRLRGHRDMITALEFIIATELPSSTDSDNNEPSTSTSTSPTTSVGAATHLLTTSKDTFIKLFSLSTHHCVETVVAHRAEAWSLAFDSKTGTIISGGGEGEIKLWKLHPHVLFRSPSTSSTPSTAPLERAITPLALFNPSTTSSHTFHISQISFHPTLPILGIITGEKTVDVYKIRSEEELSKKVARRKKREREKKKLKAGGVGVEEEEDIDLGGIEYRERLVLWTVLRAGGKVRSFDWAPDTVKAKGDVSILLSLSSNSLEVYKLPAAPSTPDLISIKQYTLDLPGHRTDVRALAVSSDDTLIASAANGSVKIWNRLTTKCVRTMEEGGYALCCEFLPGDRHLVVGTKSGALLLYDLSSSSLSESFQAHMGPIWSIAIRPDGKGLVTGSGDKDIKFWEFAVRVIKPDLGEDAEATSGKNGSEGTKVLTMKHTKTLKMTDDVLAVKFSPDERLLAVSLLDSTVKVFFADSLKFALSLYGHKLPVLSLDISSDSKLIVTCGADKNVKIWGLDFGDCHRSLFAHEESVMQVAFERGTHNFWSAGKDKMLKYWDGDKFECIQKLEGHHAEIWAMAVSRRGNFVVTASHDKSIRLWEKTDEPLFLEEERERELEALYDTNANPRDRDELRVLPNGEELPSSADPDSGAVTKSTAETLMAGERILEALELSVIDQAATLAYQEELSSLSEKAKTTVPPPSRNPVFQLYGGISPQEYVLKVVRMIPAASLHDALLVLPFGKVVQLIEHLDYWAHQEWQITLTSRVLFFLLRTHHSQIVATRALRNTMISLRANLREALRRQKDAVGYNLAALRFIQRQLEAAKTAEFYEQGGGMVEEEKVRAKIAEGVKKRKRATLKT